MPDVKLPSPVPGPIPARDDAKRVKPRRPKPERKGRPCDVKAVWPHLLFCCATFTHTRAGKHWGALGGMARVHEGVCVCVCVCLLEGRMHYENNALHCAYTLQVPLAQRAVKKWKVNIPKRVHI